MFKRSLATYFTRGNRFLVSPWNPNSFKIGKERLTNVTTSHEFCTLRCKKSGPSAPLNISLLKFHVRNNINTHQLIQPIRPYLSDACSRTILYELHCLPFDNLNQTRSYAKKGKKDRGGGKKKTGHKVDLSDEELSQVINHKKLETQMQTILEDLQQQYVSQLKLRTSAGAFDQLMVETEDGNFPLIQVAQITQKSPSMVMIDLTIMPQYLVQVKEAINNSGMNVNPQQDGTTFFVPIPKISREHREGLAKSAKALCNSSKERLRDVQNKFVKECKQKEKAGLSSDLVDNVIEYVRNVYAKFTEKAEELMKSKQQEVLGK